ncbi:MAG: phosphate ABC transporter permease subunit PstC [Armatimonadota bacterium]|nr:phosphate ABC transporter permease subunit PstC [Armatimonadota bacterium]MDR7436215.1 phosphate ABC transporter permease subunit PstC [Armatimonadota bacterium]MDR7471404.1 phosphate ABC transporter permease subunit PstC [Armatimonadota bacterium]MDR7507179.1 phosphate ABC transporter permease subunit PstC [Armatimonadota bacterium]MDR7509543.1 phosphate ABC transporter permease subunit PstC [Armatimonadota bacterium]
MEAALAASALLSVGITVAIVAVLAFETVQFFRLPLDAADPRLVPVRADLQRFAEARPDLVGHPWRLVREFFTETTWSPLFSTRRFGVLPLVAGTVLTSAIALAVAVPLGLLAAVYLSEFAPDSVRGRVKPALEVLAGVPTIVYGYFALTFVTPFLQDHLFGAALAAQNALSAGLVMGMMILPLVSSLSEDVMRAVPVDLRYGAYALGATRMEVAVRVVLPAALSGIAAACVLALSRAVGETMIVALAAGQRPTWTANPLETVETVTAFIVQVSLGDTPYGSVEYRTLFAAGMLLFAATFVMNVLSVRVVQRFRERYL